MNDDLLDPKQELTRYFNYGVVCHAIALADRLGVFSSLLERTDYRPSECDYTELSDNVCQVLAAASVLDQPQSGVFAKGPLFEEANLNKGFFTWLFIGSVVPISDPGLPGHRVLTREGQIIAAATADFGRALIDSWLAELPELGRTSASILDVGCGDGSRLRKLALAVGRGGIGIDLTVAPRSEVLDPVTGTRLELLRGDARELAPGPAVEAVDIAIMCLMAHDLLPASQFQRFLTSLALACPKIRYLCIIETCRAREDGRTDLSHGIPSIGYELLHASLGHYIPSEGEWETLLDGVHGWVRHRSERLSAPASTLLFVLRRE